MTTINSTDFIGGIAATQKGKGLRHWLAAMRQAAAERRQLRNADPRQLRDMGISGFDAAREASRPAWDLPMRFRD